MDILIKNKQRRLYEIYIILEFIDCKRLNKSTDDISRKMDEMGFTLSYKQSIAKQASIGGLLSFNKQLKTYELTHDGLTRLDADRIFFKI